MRTSALLIATLIALSPMAAQAVMRSQAQERAESKLDKASEVDGEIHGRPKPCDFNPDDHVPERLTTLKARAIKAFTDSGIPSAEAQAEYDKQATFAHDHMLNPDKDCRYLLEDLDKAEDALQ